MFQKKQFQELLTSFLNWLNQHKLHAVPLLLLSVWLWPYIGSGTNIEWGDFGIFAQGYEAMRISVLQYHQFPWFDPWIAGGVPLYANPQLGVFSIQTVLSFLFGAPIGLKLSVIIYSLLGYGSMYLLSRKYFKMTSLIASLLGLIWIFSSFFVSHIPSHYTFVWFMLAPGFVYIALTIRTLRSGIVFGLSFATMGLSQVHYSFFQIAAVCAAIILCRILFDDRHRLAILKASLLAASISLLLLAHRLMLTIENVKDFPRTMETLYDPAAGLIVSILSITLPFSTAHAEKVAKLIHYPTPHYGFGEQTASIGIFALLALLLSVTYFSYTLLNKQSAKATTKLLSVLLLLSIAFFLLGLGAFSPVSPYCLLRHLPIFDSTRVSARWFLWLALCGLLFIGYLASHAPKKSFYRFTTTGLLLLGVGELFVLNVGYQYKVLSHPVVSAPRPTSSYQFEQLSALGQSPQLPGDGGSVPKDSTLPHFYREYEATLFNLGTLQANDAFVDLNTKPTPRCSWTQGCNFVLTNNAEVTYWSPNKVVLERTAPGTIKINANNSNYFLINGARNNAIRVAEPYVDFDIKLPDSVKKITIEAKPTVGSRLQNMLSTSSNGR